uniref:RNA cap guanine-N2 methyltransferase n=1 Tax=Tanacetum cinerariifolium TaxID=118510 RepID=A0A699K7I4_TANCI|nr:RNA cap guanine-N2 methyltransferase [Tanacetum cinerariifolium]
MAENSQQQLIQQQLLMVRWSIVSKPKMTKVNNGSNDDYGDWMTYWNEFYKRNYYYNRKIQDSTWEPPLVMENLAFGGYVSYELKEDSNSVDVKIYNEHLVEPELTANRVDSVLTSSIVGYSDLQVNEPTDRNGSTGKLDSGLMLSRQMEK